ncbi:MFS transporter [Arenibaculum pallidiluteum]|uniref:MFS transporter n=1 Tax=Arenibaculum pallidiluteum TaxID=2812559 RepID=UPI001F244F4B|nr:MFS transporter [Arenibaculum pallidiluteum]
MSPRPMRTLVPALCAAEILGMAGFACFAALLPELSAEWGLSSTQAGWVSGIYFGGYMVAVPVLVSLTDRIDPRRIYLVSTLLSGAGALGFAALAEGFLSAMAFQALAGMGLAGTYMPGLKALSDRLSGAAQSRATAFYTSSFGLGTSLSFLMAGQVGMWLGWRWAFGLAGVGTLMAFLIVALVLEPRPPVRPEGPARHLLDFRPVLSNRPVMASVVAYTAHNFELFGFRSWIVAFLVFSQGLQPPGGFAVEPTVVAALLILVGIPASVLGNEMALRIGRVRWVVGVMGTSAALACVLGFAAPLPTMGVLALCVLYGATVTADSAALTSNVVAVADPAYRGATMALYSAVGFAGSFAGPLVFGTVLDLVGSQEASGWGLAFAAMGAGVAVGPLALLAERAASRRTGTCR